LNHFVSGELEGLGSNNITIRSETTREMFLLGQFAQLTHEDMLAISAEVDGVSDITPTLMLLGSPVSYEGESTTPNVFGTIRRFMDLNRIYPVEGRFLSPSDSRYRRRVAVVGAEVREELLLPDDPVGEYIQIGSEWFKIIGLMEERGEFLGNSQDNYVIIPYGTARSIIGSAKRQDISINLTVDDVDAVEEVTDRITRVLREQHNLADGEADDFSVMTPEQIMESVSNIINSITMVFGGVVSISLLVGGVGIMNIMLVSVTERTREIGICKALGAHRSDILMQFLIEALVLCLLGGLIGLVLGYGLGAMISGMLPGFPAAYVPWWAALLSFGFSAGVGIVFGILPAAKAANLDPIDALRYE
ncbi:MAG TPA: ABC transporter permease, partial [Gammaproteobacteria bacterium]